MIDINSVAMELAVQASEQKLAEAQRQCPKTLEQVIRFAVNSGAKAFAETREYMVQDIIDRIHVALIAAVYAGHIEAADPKAKFNGIGADSHQHREEYMNYAANFDFPWGDYGKIESDTVFNVVSDHMWDTYSSGVYKLFEEEEK